ncbi:MAG: glycosyltransferase family 9 protein [Candidatus Gracilibacteria bacterium]|nr:glycosyltransferase family 9 protein [Candidatus Gracilibacteria bacterium]
MNIKILRYIDKYFFGFLILIFFVFKYLYIFRKNELVKNPKKILIIRLWALGSSLLSFPMIKQLEEYYGKNVEFDLLATNRNISVFKNQEYFKNIYNIFNLKDFLNIILSFKKYDIIIDTEEYFKLSGLLSIWLGKIGIGFSNLKVRGLSYNLSVKYNGEQHSILTSLDLISKLGIKYKIPEKMEKLIYLDKDKLKVDNFLKNYNGKKIICIHAGGAETSAERFWSNKNWINLIQKILANNSDTIILLSGTKFEEESISEISNSFQNNKNLINICGNFNLFEFAYLLEKVNLMISNDTGPMHLSASMGTKTIGLFGPNLPSRFGAYPLNKNINLYKGDGTAYINVHLGKFEKCSKDIINRISVDDVYKNITL